MVWRTSAGGVFLFGGDGDLHVAVIFAIELGQMAHDGIVLARGQIGAARVANASFAADGGCDGGFGGVEAPISDVGPSRGGVAGAAGEQFDVVHGR